MNLTYMIIDVLQQYSSKEITKSTHPMKRTEIVKRLKEQYPNENITYKRVRTALDSIVNDEAVLPDEQKRICYRTYSAQGGIARTDYYLNNTITDVEFKYLVDSVLYSRIFNTEDARNLAKRIQMLSGKNLVELTPYVNNSFGEQRFFLQKKVLENVEKLMDAIRKFQYITFRWNDYDVDNGKIVLRHVDDRVAKPITLLLNDGRYFLFARRYGCKELRTYSIDLMENIETVSKKDDHLGNGEMEKDFQYSRYISQHPFMMGGIPHRYRLRVERVMFARVVDDFALGIRIIPGTQTEQTVDVEVRASRKGMVYWLLSHFDTAQLIDNSDSELAKELADAVEKLKGFYQND